MMNESTVRVRMPNGNECNLPADHPALVHVDIVDKPTHTPAGDPVPLKTNPLHADQEAVTADLVTRIEAINATRDPDDQISTSGNRADLVAALAEARQDDPEAGATGEEE